MVELLARLSEKMIRRGCGWGNQLSWLENAEKEHSRILFHAILARSNPRQHPQVPIEDSINESQALWNLPSSKTVPRRSNELANELKTMLCFSKEVFFIDLHFDVEKERYWKSIREFLSMFFSGEIEKIEPRIEIYVSGGDNKPDYNLFKRTTQKHLAKIIPKGFKVRIIRLEEKDDGEKIHNRYIITALGGVKFGIGIDEGSQNQTDDINLLGRKQYYKRYQQYAGPSSAFNLADPPVEIEGKLSN